MVIVLHPISRLFRRSRVGDSDLKNKENGKPPTKFEHTDLQAPLSQSSSQTLNELANQLNVSEATATLTFTCQAIWKEERKKNLETIHFQMFVLYFIPEMTLTCVCLKAIQITFLFGSDLFESIYSNAWSFVFVVVVLICFR